MICLEKTDRSAPVEAREQFLREVTHALPPHHVLIATCNRVELYHGDGEAPRAIAEHLFRVVSGLESPCLGDTNVHGQVKKAYCSALSAGHASSGLHRLFQRALHVGKTVRHKTGIARGALSYCRATADLVKCHAPALARQSVLVIGVHAMSRNIVELLCHAGARDLCLANRTRKPAVALADEFHCAWAPLACVSAKNVTPS